MNAICFVTAMRTRLLGDDLQGVHQLSISDQVTRWGAIRNLRAWVSEAIESILSTLDNRLIALKNTRHLSLKVTCISDSVTQDGKG